MFSGAKKGAVVFNTTNTRFVFATGVLMWMLTGFSTTTVGAQTAPLSVLVNPSVRSIGMGETGGADASDPTNGYLNPAVLPNGTSVYLSGFHQQVLNNLSNDIRLKGFYAGGSYEFGLGSGIGLGIAGQVRYVLTDYGESVVTNALSQTTGTINPKDSYVGLTLAAGVRFSDAVSIGLGGDIQGLGDRPRFRGYRGTGRNCLRCRSAARVYRHVAERLGNGCRACGERLEPQRRVPGEWI
ncbi:MAG: hypothetical protein OEN01_15440 [Candidatus Krumholzibacteria bacterium]|nr:hypothetical protein [Candidatus Krumholzibacteria bacterium]